MNISNNDCFHVHTYRCGHAENVSDEEYIKAALSIGAKGIWFTDHAPFPGDPFGNRMDYCQLNEYISTLSSLKIKYDTKIAVHIGLEIEYFPKFDKDGYYKYLCDNPNIEILMLGQHMAETETGYTFSWDKEKLNNDEYIALGEAEKQGIESGYFSVVAHPDRIFRRQKVWTDNMQKVADQVIEAAKLNNVVLEQNESSKRDKYHYWNEFWAQVTDVPIVHGLDAHFISELIHRRRVGYRG